MREENRIVQKGKKRKLGERDFYVSVGQKNMQES